MKNDITVSELVIDTYCGVSSCMKSLWVGDLKGVGPIHFSSNTHEQVFFVIFVNS